MPPKKSNRRKGTNPQVRTVQDVEVAGFPSSGSNSGGDPTSPSATNQDREDFQKLLFQISTVKVNDNEGNKSSGSSNAKIGKSGSDSKANNNNVESQKSHPPGIQPGTSAQNTQRGNQSKPTADNRKRGSRVEHVEGRKPTESPKGPPRSSSTTIGHAISELLEQKIADLNVKKRGKKKQEAMSQESSTQKNNPPQNKASDKSEVLAWNKSEKLRWSQIEESKHPQTGRSLKIKLPPKTRPGHLPRESSLNSPKHSVDMRDGKETASPRGQNSPKRGSISQPGSTDKSPDVLDQDPMLLLQAAINNILPKAKERSSFHCRPCDKVFMDVERHFEKQKENHAFKWKMDLRETTVEFLPAPTPHHLQLITDLIMATAVEHGMTKAQHSDAIGTRQRLNDITDKFPGCQVRLFGSHYTGLALAENKLLNMDLYVPNKDDAASMFLKFVTAIEADSRFINVERVIATNFAHASVTDKMTGYQIQLSLNNTGAYNTGKLLNHYVEMDPRVRPLGIAFRYWGKLCKVDGGEAGSWQGHAFPIMLVHYLQQEGVLPVLHEMVDNPDGNPEIYKDPKQLKGEWSTSNKKSVGELWLGMFRYYAVEHNVESHVVTITQLKPFLRSDTKWQAKRIAVIDPFQPKHNISRHISANMYDYVHHCLLATTCALGIPHTETGPIFGFIRPGLGSAIFQKCPAILEEYNTINDLYFDLVLRGTNTFDAGILRKDNETRMPELLNDLEKSKVFSLMHQRMRILSDPPKSPEPTSPLLNAHDQWCVTPFQASTLASKCHQNLLQFKFDENSFAGYEKPPVGCTSCHRNGHLRSSCPDEIVPKLPQLPAVTKELLSILDELSHQVFDAWGAGPAEHRFRSDVRDDLLHYLRQFYPDVELSLFGSSCNGFGGKISDIDMCLTFRSNSNGEGLNFPLIVEEVTHNLRGHKGVYRLLPITTAKVPIVKFEYGRCHIQVDVSLYNMLGLMNTQLLLTYSTIDPRVRPLVYMMKRLAKTTGIGDASKGSLSSYAYSLMTLYFLQQVQPPVLPVLQELTEPGTKASAVFVENANVYFFKVQNMQHLDAVWPHRNENKSSVGELWLQLLRFYASHEFHESQKVVCIRRKAPLFKFDKLWTSTNICIEDPFDLSHNLGSGLSKRMNIFIVKTFQQACKHFSKMPTQEVLQHFPHLEAYYFSERSLVIGKPPSDRGCHICHSIGHVQNDCPLRRRGQGGGFGNRGKGGNEGKEGNGANGGNRGNGRSNHNHFHNQRAPNNREHRQTPQEVAKHPPLGFHSPQLSQEAVGQMVNRMQFIGQPRPQPRSQPMPQHMPQPRSQPMPQPRSQPMPMSQPMPQPMVQHMPQRIPLRMPQSMPQGMTQSMPQGMPQSMPQGMPPGMPQGMPPGIPQGMPRPMQMVPPLVAGPSVLGMRPPQMWR